MKKDETINNDYNKFLMSKDITVKTEMKRSVFDNEIWVALPAEIQFNRMAKLTSSILKEGDDWGERVMSKRREKRKFIYPRGKTQSMWEKKQ